MGIRCFIAVELPDSLKAEISKLTSALKTTGADVKWVSDAQAHLTLKFLGDTDETAVPSIVGALEKKMSPYSPFYITISGVGCFPGRSRPRVIWVGMEYVAGLISLQRDIDSEMSRFGYQPEKRDFSPHITIGRIRSQRRVLELVRKLDEHSRLNFEKLLISRIALMKSELKPAGAEYSTLAEIPFGRRSDVQ